MVGVWSGISVLDLAIIGLVKIMVGLMRCVKLSYRPHIRLPYTPLGVVVIEAY